VIGIGSLGSQLHLCYELILPAMAMMRRAIAMYRSEVN
jgi:hypothetical protein